jgi:hypothetical protein
MSPTLTSARNLGTTNARPLNCPAYGSTEGLQCISPNIPRFQVACHSLRWYEPLCHFLFTLSREGSHAEGGKGTCNLAAHGFSQFPFEEEFASGIALVLQALRGGDISLECPQLQKANDKDWRRIVVLPRPSWCST